MVIRSLRDTAEYSAYALDQLTKLLQEQMEQVKKNPKADIQDPETSDAVNALNEGASTGIARALGLLLTQPAGATLVAQLNQAAGAVIDQWHKQQHSKHHPDVRAIIFGEMDDLNITWWLRKMEEDYITPNELNKRIEVIPAAAGLIWAHDPDRVELAKQELLFFPVSNARALAPAGSKATSKLAVSIKASGNTSGTHWSLLIVPVPTRTSVHYDSASPINKQAAISLNSAIETVVKKGAFMLYQYTQTPQQSVNPGAKNNGAACGPIMCVIVEDLLKANSAALPRIGQFGA